MAVEALERENPDAGSAKTLFKEATSSTSMWSTSGTPALKMLMASERSTDDEKNRCLERSPSSGSMRQAAQEAGVTMATAACSAPRHLKIRQEPVTRR